MNKTLTDSQLNLVLLMRIKRFGFMLVKVRNGLPYQADVFQPDFLNFYPQEEVDLCSADRKLLDFLSFIGFGQLVFSVSEGTFSCFHDYYVKNVGYKTYLLEKDDVYEELEQNYLEKHPHVRYNINEGFNNRRGSTERDAYRPDDMSV